jgi:hypothetical protein
MLQKVGLKSLLMMSTCCEHNQQQRAREYQLSTMVFIFSPRTNIRECIGVKSSFAVITGKSSPVLKLSAKQGSHESQQVREIAEFSRNNKLLSRSQSFVHQAALLKGTTSGLFECQESNQWCSPVKWLWWLDKRAFIRSWTDSGC